jgi:hypothetical protein
VGAPEQHFPNRHHLQTRCLYRESGFEVAEIPVSGNYVGRIVAELLAIRKQSIEWFELKTGRFTLNTSGFRFG